MAFQLELRSSRARNLINQRVEQSRVINKIVNEVHPFYKRWESRLEGVLTRE